MAQLLTDDNTRAAHTVEPANGRAFTLEEMQAFVEGYIQIVQLPNGQVLIMNEDAKVDTRLERFTLNTTATNLARAAGIAADDFVVGPCVLASRTEAGFDETGFDEAGLDEEQE